MLAVEQLRLYVNGTGVSVREWSVTGCTLHIHPGKWVSATYRVEVRQEVEREARAGMELRDDAERRERGEVLVVLVRPLQLLLGRADAEVVQDDVALRVCEF